MLLQALQDSLAALYDVPVEYCVTDFLFTDPALLPEAIRCTGTDEQVLVRESEPASVGLFLHADLLARLERTPPTVALNQDNLADYWAALEGVSHFQYLAWASGHDRGVSLLELELQAEIDKFIISWQLLAGQTERIPRELHHVLFERCRVDPTLCADRRGLYQRANHYAARFCRSLEHELQGAPLAVPASVLSRLRRFYRLTGSAKIHFIEGFAG
jgi:hypothetical protein